MNIILCENKAPTELRRTTISRKAYFVAYTYTETDKQVLGR